MLSKKKIIIGVHGLGNKPPKYILENWWKKSIVEGLFIQGGSESKLNFELLYWADILYQHPLNPNVTDEDDEFYVDHPYMPASSAIKKAPSKIKERILGYIDRFLDEVFLNDDFTINFSRITDKIVHGYFKDLESYYKAKYLGAKNQEFYARDLIRNRLAFALKRHRRKSILLIGHSMGSIVAYDVLTQLTPDIKIDTLVTIGSPLGIPIVKSRIVAEQSASNLHEHRLCTPENVTRKWYNLSDLDDRIAINYNLSDDYCANEAGILPEDFIVSNDYIYKGEENSHSSYGYLRTPEMTKIIADFLNKPEPAIYDGVFESFKNIIGRK